MRSRLEIRLQRLEQQAKRRHPTRGNPQLEADVNHLGRLEMARFCEAFRASQRGEPRFEELTKLIDRSRARQERGWTQVDRDALEEQDRGKEQALHRIRQALWRRHKVPYVHHFDVVDLNEDEVKQLAEAAESATCARHLDAVADVVGRLRFDGRVMDMATFEALVIRGEIAAQPPEPDWREIPG